MTICDTQLTACETLSSMVDHGISIDEPLWIFALHLARRSHAIGFGWNCLCSLWYIQYSIIYASPLWHHKVAAVAGFTLIRNRLAISLDTHTYLIVQWFNVASKAFLPLWMQYYLKPCEAGGHNRNRVPRTLMNSLAAFSFVLLINALSTPTILHHDTDGWDGKKKTIKQKHVTNDTYI